MSSNRNIPSPITHIPVKNLSVVWVQSQRPLNKTWAKHIADNLDPDLFDPIVVTKPNGNGIFHIIDGQHRRHALEMWTNNANEQAPCRIISDADPARAAEIWLEINSSRKSPKPIHGFNVAVIAKREPEVTIHGVVHANGFQISNYKQANSISAVGALKIVYNRHGKVTLDRTLRLLRILWSGDPTSVTSPLMRGFGIFVHEFGSHADPKRLVSKIGQWSPYDLWQAAEARKQSSLEKLDEAIAELILREYNKGLVAGSKLKHKG